MFFFNKFKIKINNVSFKSNKKNLFLVIRKSPAEYDFIAYILNQLKDQFNIFTIFNNKKSYSLLKTNKFLFNNWKNTSFGYVISDSLRFLPLRVIAKLLKKIKQDDFSVSQFNLNKNYYNLKDLKREIYLKVKCRNPNFSDNDVLFCSFQNKSGWLETFKKNKNKIIYFPEKSNLELVKDKNYKTNLSKKKILSLFPNKDSYQKYKNQIEFNQYIYCAFPKFSSEWTKHLIKKPKKKIKYQATVFYKTLESDYFFNKKKYFNQLQTIIFLLKKYKFSINFNLHPLARKGFETYFNNDELRNFKISKNNMAQDIYDSDLLLFKYATNSILDCVAYNKYPIELWSLKNKKYFIPSIYSKKKLTLRCDNSKQLEKYINEFLNKKKYPKIDSQREKYFFNNKKTKNVIKKIKKFILS